MSKNVKKICSLRGILLVNKTISNFFCSALMTSTLSFDHPSISVTSPPSLLPHTCRPVPVCSRPGPKLCPLSLLSRPSSLLPRCRLRPVAAHGKLQPRRGQQLCHGGARLHLERRRRHVRFGPVRGRPLSHPAVLPLGGGVALQQVGAGPAP